METTRGIDTPRRAWGLLLALIAAMTAWRLGVAAILPVTQDEAYYFDWARSLAWGYFDHPPGVALLGIGTWLAPGSALAARAGTLIASALTLFILARFFRNCGLTAPRDLALALVLVFATIPGFAGGVITTPDTVLGLAWALALHESERALAGQRRRWLSAGAAVGLGLLGKYTMVLIGPVLLLAILFSDPRALRTRWPYLGGLVALLVFAPNILWNQHNEWLSMRFQFGHGFSTEVGTLPVGDPGAIEHVGPQSVGERLGSLSDYLGTQLAFWGLIAIPMLLAPLINRARRNQPSQEMAGILARHAKPLLWAATLFPLGFFALVATGSEVEPNWPAVYLISAAPLAALLLRNLRPWVLTAALGNLLLLSLYAFHSATAALPLGDSQNRVLRETHGFRELAEIVGKLEEPVYADRYQTTAMLRFYAPSLDTTTQWPGLTRPSEYLRGRIAPQLDPESVDSPFWLVSGFGAPPAIAGFRSDTHRRLFDCAGQRLREAAEAPCSRPLHTWNLYRYLPDG
ncbi:glycosyltransferase family 39 protein [Thiocapsa sp.]|uniref:glycosyltransferase family 39 protein n=1 Tax=Thiocapsa sp. TaxID=2024551 RepID=UPI002BB9E304|nr:glycosyltransferase family 39 protein [Thiocapsa sp.]HSO81712.1 glycosyltransferase family 39 protein [Thiocapsa sp.]